MKDDRHLLEQQLVVDDNLLMVTESTSLTPKDTLVRAAITAAATITLPNVSKMAGRVVSITLTSESADVLTIADQDESYGWEDITMNAAGQSVVLYSDGFSWHRITSATGLGGGDNHIYEDFKRGALYGGQGVTGAPTGTAGDENTMITARGTYFEYHILGTQTITAPSFDATVPGINISMDAADNDGAEFATGIGSGAPGQFTVGAAPFFARMKFTIADVSDTDDCAFGFRKVEAYQANIDDYDEMAALNVISGDIYIETILNGAGTTSTDTTDNWADTESHELQVNVSDGGVVTYLIDGAAPTTTAAFTFDTGEVVLPFFYFLHAAASTAGIVLQEFECGYL